MRQLFENDLRGSYFADSGEDKANGSAYRHAQASAADSKIYDRAFDDQPL
jgi:hypothetical protein